MSSGFSAGLLQLLLLVPPGGAGVAGPDQVPAHRTERPKRRSILLDADLNAPPEVVFRLWTTPEGVRRFFVPGGRTHLHLAHHGFAKGGGWDRGFDFFSVAWRRVLGTLAEVCDGKDGSSPGSSRR